jgi:hypothetical protein
MTGIRIVAAALLFLVALGVQAGEDTYIRGSLIWTNERQTVIDCVSGRVCWVRVLASNPHFFLLTKRVEDIVSKGERGILAEFRGNVQSGRPSFGPSYPLDGTLTVRDIVSIVPGGCEG